MEIKPPKNTLWQIWKYGALSVIVLSLNVAIAVTMSIFISMIILMPTYWLFGMNTPDEAVYNLGFVISLIAVPIFVNITIENIFELKNESATEENSK